MNADFFIHPSPGWEILQRIGTALKEACPEQKINGFNITTQFGSESTGLNNALAKDLFEKGLASKIEFLKARPYLDCPDLSFNLPANVSIQYHVEDLPAKKHPFIRLSCSQDTADALNLIKAIAEALSRHFTIIPKALLSSEIVPESQLAGFDFAQRVIANLASETGRINQALSSSFQQFIDGVKTRTLELETQFQAKSNELDARSQAKHQELENAYTAKRNELEAKEKAFVEQVKQFELRNNTAVRRDLLNSLKTIIDKQKTLEISPEARQKRWIIHFVCLATMLAALAVVGVELGKITSMTTFEWRLLIPLSAWTIIFITTGIYYIRWNDQWFRDHERAELETRKLEADVIRASWVAELLFEWKEKKEVAVPAELLSSFTKGLFDPTRVDGKYHPMDQLEDLIRQFGNIKVTKGGVELSKGQDKG